MKLGKKLAAAGLVGILAIGQSISALAATTYSFNVGFGKPHDLSGANGPAIHYSMTAVVSASENTYLKSDMHAYYKVGSNQTNGMVVNAASSNNETRRKSAQAFKSWTDEGSAAGRECVRYQANGYRKPTANSSWTLVENRAGDINTIIS